VADSKTRRIGIILNGVTGRMGTNQHLLRSVMAIIRDGGVEAGGGERILPQPVLVGRNAAKLKHLAESSGAEKWTTDLDAALADPKNEIYFDAQTSDQRFVAVKKAIQARKHVYCEKPVALTLEDSMELYRRAEEAKVRHGVVQDKLWLPGLQKLAGLRESGFFGRVLSVRGEFGYWVFEGDTVPSQRPSWNYRKEAGGSIIFDMFPHWQYVLDSLAGRVRAVSCLGATHIEERWDEDGRPYRCTADDAAYATFKLEGGVVAQFNSSWAVRVRRDDLLTVQVDGTKGSAVAGLRKCHVQAVADTPRPVWNPDLESPVDFFRDWKEVPDPGSEKNAFRAQWELFLLHVARGDPFPWNLLEGARGVQLAEKGIESWRKQAWVEVPELTA
jgi:predicted dehydrogenase